MINVSDVSVKVETSHPDDIALKMSSSCKSPSSGHMTCSNVDDGNQGQIKYTAKINFNQTLCGLDGSRDAPTITISLAGFSKDSLTIKLSCETCDCPDRQLTSPVCNRNGALGNTKIKLL